MDSVVIRPALSEDYKSIHEINSTAFGYDYDINYTKQNLEYILLLPNYRIFVAEKDNVIVGYAHAADYDNIYSDPLKNIMAIAVLKEFRGNGIGKKLLCAIENWSHESGCSGVRLVSGTDRENAHEFYTACGYSKRKTQINFIKWF